MSDCPSDADLAAFLNESLSSEQMADIAAHVDGCTHCQGRLDERTDFGGALKDETGDPVPASEDGTKTFTVVLDSGSQVKVKPTATTTPSSGTIIMGPMPIAERHLAGLPQVPGFEVVSELGRGGMGVVYKAKHKGLSRPVALKMILAGAAADPRTLQRFLFEAEVLARVQHPQVVQVFEVNTYRGPDGAAVPYLAMELLEGGSLGDRLQKDPLPVREAAELIEGVARAVHATHVQGIIHRDLKPGNILFATPDDRTLDSKVEGLVTLVDTDIRLPKSSALPKVCDFGLAKFSESGADLTASGQVMGTPNYMAPEQATGDKRLGPPVDVYALGAILFECLAGRRPFEGDDPMVVLLKTVREPAPSVRSLRREVSRDLDAVVARCLEKDPRRRYQSAEELANDLRRFLENRPTVARPLRSVERLWLWTKRNPTVAGLTFSLLGVLVLAFALVTSLWMRAESTAEDERWQRLLARKSERNAIAATTAAEKSLEETKNQRRIADRRLAELVFARAENSCEEGRVSEGLEMFTRAVALAEANGAPDLARVGRCNLAVWNGELPPAARALPQSQPPRLAVFHPDGKHLAIAGRQSELTFWDIATGQKVRTYKPAPGGRPPLIGVVAGPPVFLTVDISPEGKTIVAGDGDGRVTVWDTESLQPRLAFEAVVKGGNVFAAVFAPDGTLWVSDVDGIRHWDVSGAKPVMLGRGSPPMGARSVINILALSPNGKFVYTGDRAGIVREWDTQTRLPGRQWSTGGWVQDLAVSHDGAQLAITGPVGKVRVVDLVGQRPYFEIDLAGAYGNGVGFSPNRPILLASDRDGNVRFWHRETGQPVGNPMKLTGEVSRMRFRGKSDQFAICAGDSVQLAEVPQPPDVLTAGRGTRIRGLDFSPKGDRVALADESVVEVYDTRTLQRTHLTSPEHGPLTLKYDADPARSRLFRGLRGSFEVLAIPEGPKPREISTFGMGQIHRIDFNRNGSQLYVLGESLLGRYDPANLERLALERPSKDIPQGTWCEVLAIHPESRELLVAYDRHVVFLDPQTLKAVRPGWNAGEGILDARYTPDGNTVLIGRRDNLAELLDAATGKPLVRSMPHGRAVVAVAISPDGSLFLTGSRDSTARFWDAKTGLPLGPPMRHAGPVTHVAFSVTGDRVATGTGTGQVTLWPVPRGDFGTPPSE